MLFPLRARMLYSLHAPGWAFALHSASQKKEQESMGGEDNGPNLEELARRRSRPGAASMPTV